MKTRFIRNNKGQVAIFIALMFQLLFLFFAMIVNVGLLVHHKINLQNSVDIAAYYGAMKQAEVLNAIAHVNYQIRQSWKLLVWRQKVLGTAGIDTADPDFPWAKLRNAGQNALGEVLAGGTADPAKSSSFRKPNFCITYAPHEVAGQSTPTSENSCRFMYRPTQVVLPTAGVLFIPGFSTFGGMVAQAITQAASQAFDRCAAVGNINFLVAGSFVAAHYQDSEERAYLINHLATSLSQQTDDFYDLSGGRVSEGLRKTLQKNLTAANAADVTFEIYNSLAADTCRQPVNLQGQRGGTPNWLVPVATYPVWRYLDCLSNRDPSAGTINTVSKQLLNSTATLPQTFLQNVGVPPQIHQAVNAIKEILTIRQTLIGFEKDPWCVPYVGVKASARPRIPFMPLSGVEIRAKSFAKPFGGRIGPWYVKDWPQGIAGTARLGYKANSPQPNDQVEPISSIRVTNTGGITDPDDPAWSPNIARFVGDQLGFASERVLAFFHRAMVGPVTGFPQHYQNLNGGPLPYTINPADNQVSLRYYEKVADTITPNGPNDSLTWDYGPSNAAPKLRLMEIAAIAPNLFDMAYYSIEPDFYNNYYTQLEQYIRRPGSTWDTNRVLMGDFGSRNNIPAAKSFNIFNQIAVQNALAGPDLLSSDFAMPFVNRDPAHLLNSWVADSITDYSQNSQKFATCLSPTSAGGANSQFTNPLSPPTPGNCVNGGRVGYSVKLVSKEWLTATDLELGGQGQTGAIRNPPPGNW